MLINRFQLENQFYILCYLFAKFAVPESIALTNSIRRIEAYQGREPPGQIKDYEKHFDEVFSETLVSDYKITTGDGNNFIFGLPNIQDDYLVGHLINDSYPNVNELKSISDYKSFSKFYEKYMINSLVKNNCVLIRSDGFIYIKMTL